MSKKSNPILPPMDKSDLIAYYNKCLLGLHDNAVKIYRSKDKIHAAIIYKNEDNTFGIEELTLELYDEEEYRYTLDYGNWLPSGGAMGIYDTAETAVKENGHILNDMQEVDLASVASKKVRKLTIIRKKKLVSAFIKELFYLDGKQYQIANGETIEVDIDEGMHILNSVDSLEFIGEGSEDVIVYLKCKYHFLFGNTFKFIKKAE